MIYPWLKPQFQALLAQRTRLPHALLLSGPVGIGKSELATEFAQALLCEAPEATGACGRCAACGWFKSGNHPDFRRLAPESDEEGDAESAPSGRRGRGAGARTRQDIRIEQVRAIEGFLAIGAHRGGRGS